MQPSVEAAIAAVTASAPALGAHLTALWARLRAEVPTVAEPIVEETHDGGVRLAWSLTWVYLDAEVYPDGTFEWFFTDRQGKCAGTEEERERELPAAFFNHLRMLSPSRPGAAP